MKTPKRSNEDLIEEFKKKQTLVEPDGFLADVGEDYEAVDFNMEVMEDWLRTILTEKDAEVEKAREEGYLAVLRRAEPLMEDRMYKELCAPYQKELDEDKK